MIKVMAKNKRTYESYARDAFDDPPKGPVGVHRGNRSVAARLTPYLVVILVAALAGVLVWSLFSGSISKRFPWSTGASSQTSSTTTQTGTVTTSDSSQGTSDEPSSSTSSQSTQTQTQDVNRSTSIRVVNATNITGYAAKKAATLQQGGYTSVVAANPTGDVPSSTVVWYQQDTDAATAQDVATTLGISSVQKVSVLSAPIVVVLLD